MQALYTDSQFLQEIGPGNTSSDEKTDPYNFKMKNKIDEELWY